MQPLWLNQNQPKYWQVCESFPALQTSFPLRFPLLCQVGFSLHSLCKSLGHKSGVCTKVFLTNPFRKATFVLLDKEWHSIYLIVDAIKMLDTAHFCKQILQGLFGIAKKHGRLGLEKQLVFNPCISWLHATLVNNNMLGLFNFQNWHAIDG